MALGKLAHCVLVLVEQRGEVAQHVVIESLSTTYSKQQILDVIDAMVKANVIERYHETLYTPLKDSK